MSIFQEDCIICDEKIIMKDLEISSLLCSNCEIKPHCSACFSPNVEYMSSEHLSKDYKCVRTEVMMCNDCEEENTDRITNEIVTIE